MLERGKLDRGIVDAENLVSKNHLLRRTAD